jgi:hypothetical protein
MYESIVAYPRVVNREPPDDPKRRRAVLVFPLRLDIRYPVICGKIPVRRSIYGEEKYRETNEA